MKQIALIKTGETIGGIKDEYGDFEDWFKSGMGVQNLLQVDVYRGQRPPAPVELAGLVITGSSAMVSGKARWSENTAGWLADAVRCGTPALGICYGHQLLAHALGGRVGPNPNGRQIGTVTAKLNEAGQDDPLLGHLPWTFKVQTSHSESVLELPAGARRLASSPLDENFSIRFSEKAWGLQFHPEFSAPVMSRYIHFRSKAIRAEGLDPDILYRGVADTGLASSVLRKFVEMLPA